MYDLFVEALDLLERAKEYIKQAHDTAESRHDSYGEYYMDGCQYEIMEDTEDILQKIAELEKNK